MRDITMILILKKKHYECIYIRTVKQIYLNKNNNLRNNNIQF